MNTNAARAAFALLAAFAITAPAAQTTPPVIQGPSAGERACGSLRNHYGPYDYRTQRGHLGIVEQFHFTPQVEALRAGQSGTIESDLTYLMDTSPNHHRGLMAVIRLTERTKSLQPYGLKYSIDCYFERAVRFAPDDTVVRSLLAMHLARKGQPQQAVAHLDYASTVARDNPYSYYNIGLIYFDLGQYDKAAESVRRAQALGFERAEPLLDKLRAKGAWRDAPTDSSNASSVADAPVPTMPATAASR